MQTERFNQIRREELRKVFDEKRMAKIWRDIVRSQLRTQDIKDLYDCYDLNFNIEERVSAIRSTILKGSYKASSPLIYRLEKKYGICRHMVIPQPADALVLQVLAETIADNILKKQPSKKAFYSRARHNVKKVDEITSYGLTLKQQWVDLQKTIYEFSEEKELLVVTDLSNYYDSINVTELHKVTDILAGVDEVVVDLLFGIIQDISWKPDYMPYSGKGIPTTGLEAVRLLAHSFLFEIDAVIKAKTKDNFARWMDDIVIGVDSEKEAKEVISATSDMLKSRGLALNMAKTKVINKEGAQLDFQFKQNDYLTSATEQAKAVKVGTQKYKKLADDLFENFKNHLKDTRPKYWDKIAKRYVTCFSILESEKILALSVDLYINIPSLRKNLILYFTNLGYKKRTADVVLKIVKNLDVFDDTSLYEICTLISYWDIPVKESSKIFLKNFKNEITKISFNEAKPSHFYSVIWFMSKYSDPAELLSFLKKYENIWRTEPFLRRQVTAVLSRLYVVDEEGIVKILDSLIATGDESTVSLALQIKRFAKAEKLSSRLYPYLFPKNRHRIYPHSKFMVLCSVLNSKEIRSREDITSRIFDQIKDRYYLKILKDDYGLSPLE